MKQLAYIAAAWVLSVIHCAADGVPVTLERALAGDTSCVVARSAPKDVKIYWKNADGAIYSNVEALKVDLESDGGTIHFATNAGIFTPEFAPAGLHVEDGEELRAINTNDGAGNFHLMPNGVFYIDDDGAQVCTTDQYIERKPTPRLATQSGPMLVIDGQIHPRFNEGSPNLRVRSGVGVNADGKVVFAISEAPINFYSFATFFRDSLDCDNALYLDGALSFFYAPAIGKNFTGGAYAGLIAIATETEAENE